MADFLHYLDDPLKLQLFAFGGTEFTVGTLIGVLVSVLVLLAISRWIRNWLLGKILARGHLDLSTRETVSSLSQYLVLGAGVLIILDGAGVKLSSFTVLAGAMGVGVGFGLQNIFSNFISGLIVMFERPVKIGDHISAGGMEGNVVHIGMRATTLLTAQGSRVIVPNQNFITGVVVNWDQAGTSATALQWRMMGKVDEDEALLLGIARANADVLKAPEPSVYIISSDHAGHVMELHVWVAGDVQRRLRCISALNKSLLENLTRLGQNLAPSP
jgi:small-conductance mechanosensitive channel